LCFKDRQTKLARSRLKEVYDTYINNIFLKQILLVCVSIIKQLTLDFNTGNLNICNNVLLWEMSYRPQQWWIDYRCQPLKSTVRLVTYSQRCKTLRVKWYTCAMHVYFSNISNSFTCFFIRFLLNNSIFYCTIYDVNLLYLFDFFIMIFLMLHNYFFSYLYVTFQRVKRELDLKRGRNYKNIFYYFLINNE